MRVTRTQLGGAHTALGSVLIVPIGRDALTQVPVAEHPLGSTAVRKKAANPITFMVGLPKSEVTVGTISNWGLSERKLVGLSPRAIPASMRAWSGSRTGLSQVLL